ncbi:MAG: CHASE domain-containing protein [Parachlamydiaceae bacterium]|nr:CHASE domain-containing protein [Parachlamydiaceae bacterium]
MTRNRIILPLLVLLISLIISYINWDVANTSRENELQSHFEYSARDVNNRIEQRIISYDQVLKSVCGLFNASDNINRTEFRTFFNSLSLDKNYPGIQGVGFSLIVPPNQIKKHISSIRKDGFANYNILPEGKREIYTSIIYLEPFRNLNLRAFGYDMFSEPVRRKAMESARDSNETMISGKVNLVQETGKAVQAGFLIYLPFYRNGTPHATLSERRTNIIGWVYSPFRMGDFMEGLFGERAADLDVEIFDGKNISNETKMYDSNTHTNRKDQQLTLRKEIVFNGHVWTVIVKSTPKWGTRIGFSAARIILIVGLSISILLTIITWLLVNKRRQTIIVNAEYERANAILEKTNNELSKLNATKDKFFSIIAHDLKSPFSGFINLTELMANKTENFSLDEFTEHSKSLNKAARNLYKLLNNLLEWAQIQNGSINFTPKDSDLSNLVSQSIDTFYQRAQQKRITIINEVANQQKVYADEKMIDTVLRNLLSNAVKFTRRDGKVIVKSKCFDNGTIQIAVEDNGVGIPEDDVKRLFKVEENVGSKGTDGELSTGLGLLLCKEFVEMHGGKIWVESKVSVGSTFYFILPKANGVAK